MPNKATAYGRKMPMENKEQEIKDLEMDIPEAINDDELDNVAGGVDIIWK